MNKVNLIKAETIDKLLKRRITSNKDQITVSENGNDVVLKFANERMVFYIANGVPACALVPLFPLPKPT